MQGAAKIMEKLGSLTFQKIQHLITTVDVQPMFDGGILINVLGQLKVCEIVFFKVMGYQLKCCSVNDRSTVGAMIIDTSEATPTSKQSQRLSIIAPTV